MTELEQAMSAKQFVGRTEMVRHLKGERNCASAAIKAKCFDCCAYYEDGKVDCGVKGCPLYPWMPYRKEKAPKAERTEAQIRAVEAMQKTRRIKHTGDASLTRDASQTSSEKNESGKSGGKSA